MGEWRLSVSGNCRDFKSQSFWALLFIYLILDKTPEISYRHCGMFVDSWYLTRCIYYPLYARLGFGFKETVVNAIDMVPALKFIQEWIQNRSLGRDVKLDLCLKINSSRDPFEFPLLLHYTTNGSLSVMRNNSKFLVPQITRSRWLEKLCCVYFSGIVNVTNLLAKGPLEIILCT